MDNENKENKNNNATQKPVKEITKEAVIAELNSEERYINYFKSFNAASVKDFIDSYATHKEMWCKWGEFYIQQNEKEDMRWINAAQEHLEIIQQKKLFDAQCLWRAEKVSFAEVEICFDFSVWEKNVLHCPFIEPINDADIDLYIQYLGQENVDDTSAYDLEWQDYEEMKKAYNQEDVDHNFPEWYDFANGRRGTGVLMLLPDIRGEKEEYYAELYHETNREKNKEINEQNEAARDKRPWLHHYKKEIVDFFVSTFENKQMQQYYKAYRRNNRNSEEEEEMSSILKLLLSADEPVPIEGHYDIREALKKAQDRYIAKKTAEFLPYAYEEYKLNRSMNLGVSEDTQKHVEDYESIRKLYYDNIINGRILNGEPGDLNF